MSKKPKKWGRERGGAVVEFTLSSLVWLPLLMGTMAIGIALIREIQVTQLCRDAGHMSAYGIDFSQAANQSLILQVAGPLGITQTGGPGAIILSTITFVGGSDCQAAGLQPNSSSCPNVNQTVFSRRILIGDSTRVSSFGTPPAGDSGGNLARTDMLTNPAARTTNFPNVLALQSGQYAYVSEVYVAVKAVNWLWTSGKYTSALAIF